MGRISWLPCGRKNERVLFFHLGSECPVVFNGDINEASDTHRDAPYTYVQQFFGSFEF